MDVTQRDSPYTGKAAPRGWAGVDRIVGVVALVLGTLSLVESHRLWDGIGGSGLLPGVVGCSLSMLGAWLIIFPGPALRESGSAPRPAFKTLAAVVAACFAYLVALPLAGYLLSTMAFLFFLVAALGTRLWVALAVSAAVAAGTYIPFKIWLQMPLPAGILGF